MLQALDVLPRDAHVDNLDAHIGGLLGGFYGRAYGLNGVFDVGHDTAGNPDGFTLSVSNDFELAMGIFLAYDAGNLGGADVESDDDVLVLIGIVHGGNGERRWMRLFGGDQLAVVLQADAAVLSQVAAPDEFRVECFEPLELVGQVLCQTGRAAQFHDHVPHAGAQEELPWALTSTWSTNWSQKGCSSSVSSKGMASLAWLRSGACTMGTSAVYLRERGMTSPASSK